MRLIHHRIGLEWIMGGRKISKHRIKKIFKPGERVQIKFDRVPARFHGKIAIVQDPPYTPIGKYSKGAGYLNIKWEDGTDTKWRWPGSYFRRVINKRRSQMPDTRSYLDIISSLPADSV